MSSTHFTSKEIFIGKLPLGAQHPVRIQSMTNTNTLDVEATVKQIVALVNAGCELVRFTVPGMREVDCLNEIKQKLRAVKCDVPLIADVHFNPKVAEEAAKIVEKVRINPGNYVDRKTGKVDYSEQEYQGELDRIQERIEPLIRICKEHKTVLRIGSNHGSLSERILSRYGNTPKGMVESALEFVRICEILDFYDIVVSMKSSNTHTMIHSSRLLVQEMMKNGMNYPVHLGVTEAGEGEDGRIRSAVGIGTLLTEGIGDTIRVSLTEDPLNEIPVAQSLAKLLGDRNRLVNLTQLPITYTRRKTFEVAGIGEKKPVAVVSKQELAALQDKGSLISVSPDNVSAEFLSSIEKTKVIVHLSANEKTSLSAMRNAFAAMKDADCQSPVIIEKTYAGKKELSSLLGVVDFAALFVDGLGDGIAINIQEMSMEEEEQLAYGILQAARVRFTKPEFISCPTCGRTQFDIQSILKEIKKRTGHLRGLKIAVMGCIVNGPGEMADADYGYVGSGQDKVTLFKGQQILLRNLSQEKAVEELIKLIKADGLWRESR